MYRIAILGTENSHAMTFAKYMNLPGADGKKPFPDMEVVGVYGDEASAGAIVKEAGVAHAAQSPDEFLGKVDAVMVTARWGSRHVPYAMPYAEAGLPLFMDKPFTSDSAQAKEFIALLKKKNVLRSKIILTMILKRVFLIKPHELKPLIKCSMGHHLTKLSPYYPKYRRYLRVL